jgi:hypothetical protein
MFSPFPSIPKSKQSTNANPQTEEAPQVEEASAESTP